MSDDEKAIRDLIRRADEGEDVECAEDHVFVSGLYPRPIVGRERYREARAKTREALRQRQPNRKTTTTVERIVIAKAGDLAYEYSTFRIEWDEPAGGRGGGDGSRLRVWRKAGGRWLAEAHFARPNQEDPVRADLERLEGDWAAVSIEIDGRKVPDEEVAERSADIRMTFKGNAFTAHEKGKLVAEGDMVIDPTKVPKTLDLRVTSGEYKGKRSLAIYELEGDTLRACWTLFAVERDRPAAFETKAGSGLLLGTYKRRPPAAPDGAGKGGDERGAKQGGPKAEAVRERDKAP